MTRVHSSRFAFLPAGSHECGTKEVPSRENHGHSAWYFQKAEDEGQCEVTEMVQKRWQGRGGSHFSPAHKTHPEPLHGWQTGTGQLSVNEAASTVSLAVRTGLAHGCWSAAYFACVVMIDLPKCACSFQKDITRCDWDMIGV